MAWPTHTSAESYIPSRVVLGKLLASLIHRFFRNTGNGTTSQAGKRLGVHMRSVKGGYHFADIGGENLGLSWSFLFPQPPWKREHSSVQHSDHRTSPQGALHGLLPQLLVALAHSRIPAVPSPSLQAIPQFPMAWLAFVWPTGQEEICLRKGTGPNTFSSLPYLWCTYHVSGIILGIRRGRKE